MTTCHRSNRSPQALWRTRMSCPQLERLAQIPQMWAHWMYLDTKRTTLVLISQPFKIAILWEHRDSQIRSSWELCLEELGWKWFNSSGREVVSLEAIVRWHPGCDSIRGVNKSLGQESVYQVQNSSYYLLIKWTTKRHTWKSTRSENFVYVESR